ncbi:DUF3349 domain-containing protein [Luteimicrobium subarcticum]|uniref:Uncharacterized protein DUF3349 n=1 Tax=Luteimicrobium subarcticum TaxID=620910 RepID=A0A2M8WJH8_9MICO|nr:DUF3349 domain-containing protein [Luteimicrobium subarcticum]PJI91091.1 uncharacterized protein DUF3349 [Luteimicrobium subarcticum]
MSRVAQVVAWLREGYPAGVPEHDYAPLFALLRRTLTDDEVEDVAVTALQRADGGVVAHEDITGLIERTTAQPPLDRDVARVRALLAAAGWPLAAPPD